MTTSTSRAAYSDCEDLFDRALASSIGIRTSCKTRGAAYHLRTRLNSFRTLDRDLSRSINPADSPLAGVSAYDHLLVRVHEDANGWWIYIEPRLVQGRVEELKAAE